MFYSPLVKKASLISFEAHKNDHDQGGYPYIFHPVLLASEFEDEDCVCVALLHDVIEDHGDMFSFEYLEKEGFGPAVIDALKLLTHDRSVEYMDYVRSISVNPIARKVKLADLRHNMDDRRSDGKPFRKTGLYKEAYALLSEIDAR